MNITKEQLSQLIDTINACGVFTTPLEHRKNWNEYKQDAADRLNCCKVMLESMLIMKDADFGIKVWVKLVNGASAIYRNVTEIHFNSSMCKKICGNDTTSNHHTTAFESHVHGTGFNELTKTILEFETRGIETEKAPEFCEVISVGNNENIFPSI